MESRLSTLATCGFGVQTLLKVNRLSCPRSADTALKPYQPCSMTQPRLMAQPCLMTQPRLMAQPCLMTQPRLMAQPCFTAHRTDCTRGCTSTTTNVHHPSLIPTTSTLLQLLAVVSRCTPTFAAAGAGATGGGGRNTGFWSRSGVNDACG